MDVQGLAALGGFAVIVGTSVVAIAVHSNRTRTMAEEAAGKARDLDSWRLNLLPKDLNDNFARKGEVASELKAIHESLVRIEAHQSMMAQRFMNGGSGV